jgi:hypothetical protein
LPTLLLPSGAVVWPKLPLTKLHSLAPQVYLCMAPTEALSSLYNHCILCYLVSHLVSHCYLVSHAMTAARMIRLQTSRGCQCWTHCDCTKFVADLAAFSAQCPRRWADHCTTGKVQKLLLYCHRSNMLPWHKPRAVRCTATTACARLRGSDRTLARYEQLSSSLPQWGHTCSSRMVGGRSGCSQQQPTWAQQALPAMPGIAVAFAVPPALEGQELVTCGSNEGDCITNHTGLSKTQQQKQGEQQHKGKSAQSSACALNSLAGLQGWRAQAVPRSAMRRGGAYGSGV